MYVARLKESLPRVREKIEEAARRSGRSPEEVRLVAVTKGHPMAALDAALEVGIRDVAENRVGDLERRVADLGRDAARWHMVGRVQRRKAPRLLGITDLLHSLHSVRLARRLSRAAEEKGGELRALIQVNASGEEAKAGFSAAEALDGIGEILELPGLYIEGLMTMAPFTDDETVLRGIFRTLRELHGSAREILPDYRGEELSMGMSNDFALAVEEGSTMVRIGTALFGERIR